MCPPPALGQGLTYTKQAGRRRGREGSIPPSIPSPSVQTVLDSWAHHPRCHFRRWALSAADSAAPTPAPTPQLSSPEHSSCMGRGQSITGTPVPPLPAGCEIIGIVLHTAASLPPLCIHYSQCHHGTPNFGAAWVQGPAALGKVQGPPCSWGPWAVPRCAHSLRQPWLLWLTNCCNLWGAVRNLF